MPTSTRSHGSKPPLRKGAAANNQRPNKHSVQLNPRNKKPMTRAEMYEDLRKAVENTK